MGCSKHMVGLKMKTSHKSQIKKKKSNIQRGIPCAIRRTEQQATEPVVLWG